MENEILNYVGLNIDNIPESLKYTKPSYEVSKAIDNSTSYKVYRKINPKEISILIGENDRTTNIKERYNQSTTLSEFIENNKNDFLRLAEQTSIEKIKELENLQESFKNQIPYFIKYDKNYLWQIYYSKSENRYFMLFPSKEGETEVLFYLIKMQLLSDDNLIYVPICQEDFDETKFNKKQIDDLENYIWSFTKQWPQTIEANDGKEDKLYIIGKTKLLNNLETKYRIVISGQEQLENKYTLFKALFILSTETSYLYKFETRINKNGKLILTYNDKEITIENLHNFITSETAKQQDEKYRLKKEIEKDKENLKSLREIIDKQNVVYSNQEKQIVMFKKKKKSFFKKVRYFFSSNKKFAIDNKKIMNSLKAQIVLATGNLKDEVDDTKITEEILENSSIFTLSDLIKISKEIKELINESNNVKADINAAKLKQINMERKIENASNYLDEIEKHKKSIFEFWKFTNKDNLKSLEEGNQNIKQTTREKTFDYDNDFDDFCKAIDELQRKKLSIDECDSIFVSKEMLSAINSTITKSNSYAIEEDYEKLKEQYSKESETKKILGEIEDDYTEVKFLKKQKHRENKRDLFSIMKFNDSTTLEDFRERIREISTLLNEAYNKITVPYNIPIYYSKKNKGYIIGDINPYNLINDKDVEKIYWVSESNDYHALFFSNIILYTNYNSTLPVGMDESTNVLLKVGENKKIDELDLQILLEDDLFNVTIKKVKVVHEGKIKIDNGKN